MANNARRKLLAKTPDNDRRKLLIQAYTIYLKLKVIGHVDCVDGRYGILDQPMCSYCECMLTILWAMELNNGRS